MKPDFRKQVFKKRILTLYVLATLGLPVVAQAQSITVSDIRLEGLQRVAASSVFGRLTVSVGDQIDQDDISKIIRDVFATEYFSDIQVLTEEGVLIIRVKERPTISEIKVDGNKLIPTEALMENMEKAGLAVGQVYQPSTLEGMQLALEEQYVSQGMYGATVKLDIKEQDRNRVALTINVTEGDASKIVHINIIGNTVFDDEELMDLFELKTTHLTSMFKKDDRYAREKINGDIERLKSYYLDQGYINFDVTSTQVSLSPDKEQVYLTFNVTEGEVYKVNDVQLAGDLVGFERDLRSIILVGKDQVFSQQLVTATSEFMTRALGNRGYFFAKVEGVTRINEETKTVDVTFFVEPGARTYVNRISFKGNTDTADEVLRRELRQLEGAPASKDALERSKERMERLGYFKNESVKYETTQVPGTSDQIDVEFAVEEQPNGSVNASIGYGQIVGLQLSAGFQQVNFFGTGKTIGVNAQTSAFSTNYNFSYFDPYYTIDGVSRGFNIGYASSDYAEIGIASYGTDQFSLSTSYGYQLSETQGLSFTLGYSNTKIKDGNGPVQEIKASPSLLAGVDKYLVRPGNDRSTYDPATGLIIPITSPVLANINTLPATAFNQNKGFIDREGNKFNNFTLNTTWSESTLNQGIFPTAGGAQSLSFEIAVPGSDINYYRLNYYNEQFFPIAREWIIHTRLNLGYGDGYGDTEQMPFFQNYYAGGLGTVRGFERNSLGPRATFPQQYATTSAAFAKDEDGNVVLDPTTGYPVVAQNSVAYLLEQAVDAGGTLVVDAAGLPVYNQKLARQDLYAAGSKPSPFGGNIQTVGTLELLFPLPFIKDRGRVRSGFFIDAGNVFSSYCSDSQVANNNCLNFDVGQLRYSTGISVAWQSGAFGIMSFSLAKAFNTSNIDETEVFQFNLGNAF
jgi:outer membrane protein insertion porin family